MSKFNHERISLSEFELISPLVPEIIDQLNHKDDHIEVLEMYSTGKSGAVVCKIYLDTPKIKGYAVLKCENRIISSSSYEENEAKVWNKLEREHSEFLEEYCPEVIWKKQFVDVSVIVFTLIGGSSLKVTSLNRSNSHSDRAKVLEAVSESLLINFQKTKKLETVTSVEVFEKELSSQLKKSSRVTSFIRSSLGVDHDPGLLFLCGNIYPNPLFFLKDKRLKDIVPKLTFWKGWIHGDLHDHNIFFKVLSRDQLKHYFIDFAFAKHNGFLFFDHAYLELNQLWQLFEEHSLSKFVELLNTLDTDGSQINTGEQEAFELSRKIWNCSEREIHNEDDSIQDDLNTQILCMRILAGMNFANKRGVSDKLRLFSFVYATHFLKKLISRYNTTWNHSTELGSPHSLDLIKKTEVGLENMDLHNYSDLKLESEPTSSGWHEIYNLTRYFNKAVNPMGLMLPGDTSQYFTDESKTSFLGAVEWSLVLEFTESISKYLSGLQSVIRRNQPLHDLLPKDRKELNSIDIDRSLIWLSVNGKNHIHESIQHNFTKWRKEYLSFLRDVLKTHKGHLSEREFVLIIYVPKTGLSEREMRTIETFEEELSDSISFIFFSEYQEVLEPFDKIENSHIVNCSFQNFMTGLKEIYSTIQERTSKIWIPKRMLTKGDQINVEPFELPAETFQWLDEYLEIVHPEALLMNIPKERQLILDFWRGHEISWQDLNSEADVPRKIYEELFPKLWDELAKYSNQRVNLYHNAGAGGTTLGKRIAWDMKEYFPTVVIRKYSESLHERIQELFHLSDLPVLIVADGALASLSEIDRLYHKLKESNVRSVLLHIQRTSNKKPRPFTLYDPFYPEEVQSFIDKFKLFQPESISKLQRVLDDPQYRSPFFFGLISFDKEYKKLPNYIEYHMTQINNEWERNFLIDCSIFTIFSQAHFPLSLAVKLARHEDRGYRFPSPSLTPLLKVEQKGIRVIHPRIAEEILVQTLGSKENPESWHNEFHYRVIQLFNKIESTYDATFSDPEQQEYLLDWVQQVFITRDPLKDDQNYKRAFSELIWKVRTNESKLEIFEKITTMFPNQPHFWNHKGRLYMYLLTDSTYTKAEECLKRAIDLEDSDPVHHHTLGMVYRKEVKRILDERKKVSRTLTPEERKLYVIETMEEISSLVLQSQESFTESLFFDISNEYAYVTNVQLIIEVVSSLKAISGVETFNEFYRLSKELEEMIFNLIPKAEELLMELKKLIGEHRNNKYVTGFEDDLLTIVDNYDELINGLNIKLNSAGGGKNEIRRSLASALFVSSGRSWNTIKHNQLERISELTLANHYNQNATHYDYWLWINAYRRQESFDINKAIEIVSIWREREDSLESRFYLYILKYLMYRQGLIVDPEIIKNLIDQCRELSGNRSEKTSSLFWLSKEPEWCPIIHPKDLGGWNVSKTLWNKYHLLEEVTARVHKISGSQSGKLMIDSIEAFFVPGPDIKQSRDINKEVTCLIGFSYDGLRAWNVKLKVD